ncbi:MAG: hypothetical protein ACXWJV_09940, partial [Hyphomicrobium sp.]
QWGDRWIHGRKRAPVRVLERRSGKEVAQIEVTSPEGEPLSLDDVVVVPGPGANDAVRRRFGRHVR